MSKTFHVVGLMSGTSLDGLDLAYCTFQKENYKHFEILSATTVKYPSELQTKLRNSTNLNGFELVNLDHQLGQWMGLQINDFVQKEKVLPEIISSHGHTVFHQPEKGFTHQIGNLYEIYKSTRIPVIGDFRSLDVTLGGHGAPLVPIGDALLFGNYDFCLNLGGFSNISFDQNKTRIAFDVCPVNIVLNYLAKKTGLEYDKNGEVGSKGKIDEKLFRQLNELEYYNLKGPKSLGVEWVNDNIKPLLENTESTIEDQLYTYYHHIACQINRSINKHANENKHQKLLVTGGGAQNIFLMELLKKKLDLNIECVVPSKKIVSFKEALIFALLGLLRWQNKVNVLRSVTGGSYDTSSGIIVNNLIVK